MARFLAFFMLFHWSLTFFQPEVSFKFTISSKNEKYWIQQLIDRFLSHLLFNSNKCIFGKTWHFLSVEIRNRFSFFWHSCRCMIDTNSVNMIAWFFKRPLKEIRDHMYCVMLVLTKNWVSLSKVRKCNFFDGRNCVIISRIMNVSHYHKK